MIFDVTKVLVVDDEPTIREVVVSERRGGRRPRSRDRAGSRGGHGGRIWAEPRPEGGTRVSFTLPAPA